MEMFVGLAVFAIDVVAIRRKIQRKVFDVAAIHVSHELAVTNVRNMSCLAAWCPEDLP